MIQPEEYYMRLAMEQAKLAEADNEVPIGAIVVSHGKIIAKAHNQVELLQDATAHAEMIALTAASHALGSKYLTDCALYVTVEPCMMCAAAIHWSKLGALYYAASDNRYGYTKLDTALLDDKTFVNSGTLGVECGHLMQSFFQRKREINKL